VVASGQECDLDGADQVLPGLEGDAFLADRAYDADERVTELLQSAGNTPR